MRDRQIDSGFRGTSRFELLSELGAGAAGVVYEVLDRETGERVALKTLHGVNKRALITLKNEYRSLREIVHPNLVELGELIEESGEWFFTMELIEGSDFLGYVRPDGQLDAERLRSCTVQLSRALQFLHAHGKIHRDIKPSNIRVTRDGRAVLLDFGLVAETHESRDASGIVEGTPDYMAPEQARGKPLGPEADVYALGVVLYEALTGAVPFTSDNMTQLVLRKNAMDPPAPRELDTSLPDDLDSVCMWMLSRRPAQRPTVVDILDALTVADDLVASSGSVSPMPSNDIEFVGRNKELSVLMTALEQARAGDSRGVYIQSESGVGKSELMRRFVSLARESHEDVVVLAGRCHERETVPYKALDEIVDQIASRIAVLDHDAVIRALPPDAHLAVDVFPVFRRITTIDLIARPDIAGIDATLLRRRAFEATRAFLDAMVGDRTAIICIDDIHGADEDSRALLTHLLSPSLRYLLVLTARAEPMSAQAPAWIPCPTYTISLQPLPVDDAEQLASALLARAGKHPESAAAIAAAADGHPLFIHELVYRPGEDLPEGAGVDDLVWERVQAAERDARRVLALLAIAGVPVEQRTLAVAAEIDYRAFRAVVSRLSDDHLVRTNGVLRTDSIEVYHNSVRSTLLDRTEDAALVRLHHLFAETLEATDPDNVSALAFHWLAAGARDRALECMTRAAQRADRALAFERAAELYAGAIELGAETDAGVRRLRAKLGAALFHAGRSYDGARQYLAAAQGSSDIAAGELARRAAAALLSCGHVVAGMQVLGDVIAELGLDAIAAAPATPSWTRLRHGAFRARPAAHLDAHESARIDVCWSVASGLADIDPDTATRFQTSHFELAFGSGDTYRFGRALAQEAMLAAARRGPAQRRHAERACTHLELLAKTGNPHLRALHSLSEAALDTHRGDWRQGAGRAARAETILVEQCSGVATELVAAQLLRFTCMAHLGELTSLIGELHSRLAQAEQRGDRYATSTLSTGTINMAWLVVGTSADADAHVDAAMKGWEGDEFCLQHARALVARTNIDLHTGDADRAWGRLTERWPAIAESTAMRCTLLRTDLLFARARAAVLAAERARDDEREVFLAVAVADAYQLEREDMGYASGAAHLVRAGIAALRREPEAAARELERAEAFFVALEMPLLLAAARARRNEPRATADLRSLGVADVEATLRLLSPGLDAVHVEANNYGRL